MAWICVMVDLTLLSISSRIMTANGTLGSSIIISELTISPMLGNFGRITFREIWLGYRGTM